MALLHFEARADTRLQLDGHLGACEDRLPRVEMLQGVGPFGGEHYEQQGAEV